MQWLNGFARYCSVGLINTALHAAVFLFLHWTFGVIQTYSNFAGFLSAVSLSYYLNARFTFDSQRSWRRYLLFLTIMALLSLCTGVAGDVFRWRPEFTLLLFSAISLGCGYYISRRLVFPGRLS